jgi:phosphotransferase system  glucose/maltose/N-acetylglucosamine-specific IIC component
LQASHVVGWGCSAMILGDGSRLLKPFGLHHPA